MEKTIIFGHHVAHIHAGEHRAVLRIDERILPVELAHMLDEAGDIHVRNVQLDDNGFGVIGITHALPASDLLSEVCDAITRVYKTDTIVSNLRP